LKFAKAHNEGNIIKNGKHIIQGLECISEPLSFHTSEVLNTVDLSFKTHEKKKDLNPDEFIRALETFGHKGELVKVNYRC
jgi:hypothetical protein